MKNRKVYIYLGCLGIILLTLGISVALFNYIGNGSTANTITSGGIVFHYQEGNRSISITNALPLSDNDGKSQSQYFDFEVTSETLSEVEIPYVVTARMGKSSNLDPNAIKIWVSDQSNVEIEEAKVYGTLPQYSEIDVQDHIEKVIYTGKVPENSNNYRKDFRVRIWIASGTNFSNGNYNNKTFSVTVNVYGNGQQAQQALALSPGLYDNNNNLLASWDSLVNDYGIITSYDVESNDYWADNTISDVETVTYEYINADDIAYYEEYGSSDDVYEEISTPGWYEIHWFYYEYTDESNETNYAVPIDFNNFEIEPSGMSNALTFDKYTELRNGTTLILPDGIDEVGAFAYCHNLKQIVLPDSVEIIDPNAFIAAGIESFTVPDSVEIIGDDAFRGCSNLTSFTLNDTVTTLQSGVFAYSGLTTLDIPSSVTEIGEYAFYGSNITDITIPSNVTSIGNSAFSECYSLDNVTFEEGITEIGNSAFAYSTVTSLSFPNSLTELGNDVCLRCNELETLSFGTGLTSTGYQTFRECENLNNVYLPNNITEIGYCSFCSSGLTSITLPPTLTTIRYDAFLESKLTSITIPSSVTEMEENVFVGCEDLTSVTIENGVTEIGIGAFRDTGITSITLPASMERIGRRAFEGCTDLTSVTLNEGLNHIDDRAFLNDTGLTTITFPTTLYNVDYKAFEGCTNLASVIIQPKAGYSILHSIEQQRDLQPSEWQDSSLMATYFTTTYTGAWNWYWK